MNSVNEFKFLGVVTRDAEVRVSEGGVKSARTSMALDRGKDSNGNERGADFPSIVGFGKTADFMEKFFKKGRRFFVQGKVTTGSYQKDGKTIYTTDFVVNDSAFADSKPVVQEQQAAPVNDGGFMNLPDGFEEELPFN